MCLWATCFTSFKYYCNFFYSLTSAFILASFLLFLQDYPPLSSSSRSTTTITTTASATSPSTSTYTPISWTPSPLPSVTAVTQSDHQCYEKKNHFCQHKSGTWCQKEKNYIHTCIFGCACRCSFLKNGKIKLAVARIRKHRGFCDPEKFHVSRADCS